jgi:hypothetical protein
MAKYFFTASEDASDEMAALFNFVWPTASALWNLRWQVKGFLAEAPNAPNDHLTQRFITGSGIQGADLKNACIDQSWEDQQERLAQIILMNAFSIYENWADQILVLIGEPQDSGGRLQRPDNAGQIGLSGTVSALTAVESATLKAAYHPIYAAEKRYSISILPNLALCYRYFKELRNCLAHRGGLASSRAETAYLAFTPVSSHASLGMKGALVHFPAIEGQRVRLSLRGVVGFSEVLLRIISTVDAELSKAKAAESYFIERVRTPKTLQPGTLSSDIKRRNAQVAKRCMAVGLPRPRDIGAVYLLLRAAGILRA